MKHVCLALVLLVVSSIAFATSLTTQRVKNGRVISIGDSISQVQQARPERRSGNSYGWRIDHQRYLWAQVRGGRVCRLNVVLRTRRR